MPGFHPELARGRFIPRFKTRAWSLRLLQGMKMRGAKAPEGIIIENLTIEASGDQPPVRLRVFRPTGGVSPAPALYWIHGGGFIQGQPEQDDRTSIAFARELGVVVVAVAYRLAPAHPYPAAMDDVYAGIEWVARNAETLGIDLDRIAIGGASAGGGLAAGLILRVHDHGPITPVLQLLVYPMLDDRTTVRADVDTTYMRVWLPQNNRFAWNAYLGHEPGGADAPEYAAPARRQNLAGLPPAWIGVGANDLFHDEDVEYARRLQEAGVPCQVTIVEGAFHGFDAVFSKTDVAQEFLRDQIGALRAALQPAQIGE